MDADACSFQCGEHGRNRCRAVVGTCGQPVSVHPDFAHGRYAAQSFQGLPGMGLRSPGAGDGKLHVDGIASQLAFEFVRRSGRHDGAAVDDGEPVCQLVGFVQVVRCQQYGEALARGQAGYLVPHRRA
ncbi:MAG TPA: hypothetical protein VG253_28550 [Streptosporangiaceae bacterium]|jgi:hypothetical protein|nr:hypothetical protein [Streptosporangiaceae bacterium]